MAIKQRSNRRFTISADDHGDILEIGPAATSQSIGTMVIQFNPTAGCDYEVVLMGRVFGQNGVDFPYMPVPYRRVTLDNVASDYAIVIDNITGASMIQVPANWALAFQVSCATGTCAVASWDLLGSSTP